MDLHNEGTLAFSLTHDAKHLVKFLGKLLGSFYVHQFPCFDTQVSQSKFSEELIKQKLRGINPLRHFPFLDIYCILTDDNFVLITFLF